MGPHQNIESEVIRERRGVKDVIAEYRKQKFPRARRVKRFIDNIRTRSVVERYMREWKRPLRRPPRRWEDNCQAIWANIKNKGEIEKGMEAD